MWFVSISFRENLHLVYSHLNTLRYLEATAVLCLLSKQYIVCPIIATHIPHGILNILHYDTGIGLSSSAVLLDFLLDVKT